MSAENSGKPSGGRGSAPNPTAHSAPPDHLTGGERVAPASTRTLPPLSAFGRSVMRPNEKSSARPRSIAV